MPDLLLEIGLEEVPARMLASAEAELARRVVSLLRRVSLLGSEHESSAKRFSTPRRLAVLVADVREKQNDSHARVLGPSVQVGFKEGKPTPAAESFARKNGLTVEQLSREQTDKGEYLAANTIKPGRTAAEVLAEELPKELAAIYWAKNMYWRPGKPERFVRPVRWLLCLLGSEIVPVAFGGKTAANLTFGHRVLHGDTSIAIAAPGDYAASLEVAHVLPDVELRRHRIRKALDRVCRTLPNTRWREDHALVDKLTHLTEWPSVIAGNFEREYLALPEEVLVTVMRDHQNYFAVEDTSGALAPHFLAVLNTETTPAGEALIRHGNERVLRARFNDARFFWEFDQRISLAERVKLLESVTFQKDLGSYAAKSARVAKVASTLGVQAGEREASVSIESLMAAVVYAKTDLTAELVKEFTELQGVIGGLYARAQGLNAAVADAIYDHYRPASMDDRIPRTPEGQLLALADKADTIAGMFSLGLEPTGSKDPFALRRAANGIVKILAEADPAIPLTLGDIADAATPSSAPAEPLRRRIEVFLAERLEFYLREARAQAYDVVAAVLAAGANDVRDAIARADAVTAMRGSQDFAAVCAAFKRMKNIVAQAEPGARSAEGNNTAPLHPAQQDLMTAAAKTEAAVTPLYAAHDYTRALEEIATLRGPIDRFFEQVMVMDPDESVRTSRVLLLKTILGNFSKIADFSEIVIAG